MNIHLSNKSIYSYSFIEERKTDFIIDCLFRDSSINKHQIDILALFSGNSQQLKHDENIKTFYTVFPLHPDEKVNLTPEQEKYFTDGIMLTTTLELRTFYHRLKQGFIGSLPKDLFNGVIIAITETTECHKNSMMISLSLKHDQIYSFSISTNYRELNSFTREMNYRPFTGVEFQIKKGLHYCFLNEGGIGVGIYHDAKPLDYSLITALKEGYHIQFENSMFQRWVRDCLVNLETDKILANLYHDTDDGECDFLQYFKTNKRHSQKAFKDELPLRYTMNEKTNTIFERNLENFAKEYGSIAAAALQRARAKEK
jgi:hypothetical protein